MVRSPKLVMTPSAAAPGECGSHCSGDARVKAVSVRRWCGVESASEVGPYDQEHRLGYETELRIAIIELGLDEHGLDTAVYISLRNCLKAVIFGDAHPAPRLVANGIQGALGADSPEFFQCHWIGAAPALTPLTN
jgi:hypothetical protein